MNTNNNYFNKSVLLVTYNRLNYTKKVFESIRNIKPKKLYLSSDGPKLNKERDKEKVEEVRNYLLNNVDWECDVYKRFLDKNSGGCANGVSGAITWFFQNEEDGIIIEDDCVPNQSFYYYCQILLDKYKNNKQIFVIDGYAPIDIESKESYFFTKIPQNWGWATWRDRWNNYFSLDLSNYNDSIVKKFSNNKNVQNYWLDILYKIKKKEINSWAYPWAFNILNNNGIVINPTKNLVSNIGLIGEHYKVEYDKNLEKKTFELKEIVHPKRIKLNKKNINKIYTDCFYINMNYKKHSNFLPNIICCLIPFKKLRCKIRNYLKKKKEK